MAQFGALIDQWKMAIVQFALWHYQRVPHVKMLMTVGGWRQQVPPPRGSKYNAPPVGSEKRRRCGGCTSCCANLLQGFSEVIRDQLFGLQFQYFASTSAWYLDIWWYLLLYLATVQLWTRTEKMGLASWYRRLWVGRGASWHTTARRW